MMRWLVFFLLCPALVYAAEKCSSLEGKCRDACAENEVAEQGAFTDCKETEECCVIKATPENTVYRCCVHSFDARRSGTHNCSKPEGGLCAKGSGSPVECETLSFCKNGQ